MLLRTLLLFLLAAAPALTVQAQTAPVDTLSEVTVIATREETRTLQAPARVEVLEQEAIEQTASTSVADLLAAESDAAIKRYGPAGLASLSLRGSGASQTLLLLDGMPLADPQLGQVDLSLLPTVMLRSVEVMHGAGSALYGSQALGGVVHLRSLSGEMPAHVSVGGGAFGERMAAAMVGGGANATSGLVAAEYRDIQNDFPARGAVRQNADRYRASLFASGSHRLGAHHLRGGIWLNRAQRGVPGAMGTAASVARQHDSGLRAWLRDRFAVGTTQVSARGYVQQGRLRYQDPLLDLDDESRTWTTGAELDASHSFGKRAAIGAALSGGWAEARHPSLRTSAGEAHAAATLYGSARARTPAGPLALYPALRVDHYRPAGQEAVTAVAPRLGLNLRLLRWPALHLKASAGRSFRMPTLNDRYWQPGGNPDLQPERGWTVDAGLHALTGRWEVEASAFVRAARNEISWRPAAADYWQPVNVGRTRTYGLELSVGHQRPLGAVAVLQTRASYSWLRAQDLSDPEAATYGEQLPYVPREQLKGTATLELGALALDANVRYTGRRFVNADGTEPLDPYILTDLQLRLTRTISSARATLAAQVANLFDTNYMIVSGYPMPPRHLRVRLRVAFGAFSSN